MRQVLNVISYIVVFLGGIVLVAGGVIAIWGLQTSFHILLTPTVMLGLMLLCFGGAGVGFTSPARARPGVCGGCGYDRRGLPEGAACPECGAR